MQPCLVCEEEVSTTRKDAKYCSAKCRNKAWKISQREKYLKQNREYARRKRAAKKNEVEIITRSCKVCENSFTVYPSHPHARFCSTSCARKQYRLDNKEKILRQKRESNARNKAHLAKYNRRYKDQLRFSGSRLKALKRDKFTCQNCGYVGPTSTDDRSKDVVVHHIDFSGQTKKPNNRIQNLQTLCRPCHIRIHTHKL